MTESYFSAEIVVPSGAFDVDLSLTAEPGEIIALLGPNGCGKSTTLQAISGLIAPQRASIRLAGRELAGAAPVPPHRRRIGLMGQDPLLFPHLTAAANIEFGPRAQGVPRGDAQRTAQQWLARLELGRLADRLPAQLSGGQRQRVALARALAAEPDLLLLDEPLAAADVQTAGEIRQLLREHLRAAGQTTVVVTHEVLDAAVLADRVLVMDAGRIVDGGDTGRMLSEPGTEFGAALAGLNLLLGTPNGPNSLRTDAGIELAGIAETPLSGSAVAGVFPPSSVAVFPVDPDHRSGDGSPRNVWAGRVLQVEPGPSAVRLRVEVDGTATVLAADVTPAAVAALSVGPGSTVRLEVKATQVRLFVR
jgi:molybdate transport system ATP-binding protein